MKDETTSEVETKPALAAWRKHRYKFLASLVAEHLTGAKIMSIYPAGADPVEWPPSLTEQLEPILDKIEALASKDKPLDPEFTRQDLYEQVYALTRSFMSQAPGPIDQSGNHQLATLNENISHFPQMAKLCQDFHRQAVTTLASSDDEHLKAIGDVMYASQKQVLVSAGMKAQDFISLAQLVREILAVLVAFRQSQKPPVA